MLLPFVQRDVGGHLFSLRKWSKRAMFGEAPAPAAEPRDGAQRRGSIGLVEQVNLLATALSA